MKLTTKYSETTFGDTKAAKDLMLIADEIRTEYGIKGGFIVRKTFKIISKNILVINEINKISNRSYRILLWSPYKDRYVVPELKKIELAGFTKLSTHAMTVLTSFYRNGLKKSKFLS